MGSLDTLGRITAPKVVVPVASATTIFGRDGAAARRVAIGMSLAALVANVLRAAHAAVPERPVVLPRCAT